MMMMTKEQAKLFADLMLEISKLSGTDVHLDPHYKGIFQLFKDKYPDIFTDTLKYLDNCIIVARLMDSKDTLPLLCSRIHYESNIEIMNERYGVELVKALSDIADQIVL